MQYTKVFTVAAAATTVAANTYRYADSMDRALGALEEDSPDSDVSTPDSDSSDKDDYVDVYDSAGNPCKMDPATGSVYQHGKPIADLHEYLPLVDVDGEVAMKEVNGPDGAYSYVKATGVILNGEGGVMGDEVTYDVNTKHIVYSDQYENDDSSGSVMACSALALSVAVAFSLF